MAGTQAGLRPEPPPWRGRRAAAPHGAWLATSAHGL